MKIRINGDSIRMRLSPEEVDRLVSKGSIIDHCNFPNVKLTYGILSSNSNSMNAEFDGNEIKVIIPKSELLNWNTDERVGFEHTTEGGLFLLIEKDFKCLKPRKHEPEAHLYENPNVS